MEISDDDILAAKEIVVNLEIDNVAYVELVGDGRLIRRIRVVTKWKALELAQQLHKYKEELHENEKISERNTRLHPGECSVRIDKDNS